MTVASLFGPGPGKTPKMTTSEASLSRPSAGQNGAGKRAEAPTPIRLTESTLLHSVSMPAGDGGWRIQERIKTVAAGLVLCLHVGVDPPDVIKTQPCAKLECWCDPASPSHSTGGEASSPKPIEVIGKNLVGQYEFLQARARYKLLGDPTAEDVRKLALSLRKSAKEERALLHWNGHGTPRPTRAGELWVFNRQFTQYIPLAVADLAGWLGFPATFVIDTSAAGHVYDALLASCAASNADGKQMLVLAACQAHELLPMDPELPADLFTACLTTPLEIAIRWHLSAHGISCGKSKNSSSLLGSLPGQLQDRKSVLGELHWIFTALTDTLAWLQVPRETFKLLFRQDLLTASLFRNFFLAQRIMRAYGCTPLSWPVLPGPSAVTHRLWQVWDHVLDEALAVGSGAKAEATFFADQMDAFEAWLDQRLLVSIEDESDSGEHLPIILQVLLSPSHRARALCLLARYFDSSQQAARDTLDVGVLPYVLKLLQSPCAEIRPALLAIWMRLLAHEGSVQRDLAKDDAYMYFVRVLMEADDPSKDRLLALACLSAYAHYYESEVKADGLVPSLFESATVALHKGGDSNILLWTASCLGGLWAQSLETKASLVASFSRDIYDRLILPLSKHPEWRLRAAACHLASTFICPDGIELPLALLDLEQDMILHLASALLLDAAEGVRIELITCLSRWVEKHFNKFALAAYDLWEEASSKSNDDNGDTKTTTAVATGDIVRNPSLYSVVWEAVLALGLDPADAVARLASSLIDEVHMSFLFMQHHHTSSGVADKELLFIQQQRSGEGSPSPPPSSHSEGRFILPSALPLPSSFVLDRLEELIEDERKSRLGSLIAGYDSARETAEAAILTRHTAECLAVGREAKFERQLALLAHGALPTRLAFHPLSDRLIVADARNRVSLWDWQANTKSSFFVNGNPERATQISGLLAIPEDRLLVASTDGVVRCWAPDLEAEERPAELLAVHQMSTVGQGEQQVFEVDWADSKCYAVATQDRSLQAWDLGQQRGYKAAVLSSDSKSPTALRASWHQRDTVYVGFASGLLSAYDLRSPAVNSVQAHDAWLVEIVEAGSLHQLMTASVLGELALHDTRNLSAPLAKWDILSGHSGLLTFAGHEALPVVAIGSTDQALRFLALPDEYHSQQQHMLLNTVKYHEGLFGQRIGAPVASAFHPNRPVFALASSDMVVGLYGCLYDL